MAEFQEDQAAGLRRLFGREQTRIITFASGSVGVGKSILVANLAASLALRGKEVLVLDENTRKCVASYFGAHAQYDLQHVINKEKSLSDVLLAVASGVRILPAARTVAKLGKLSLHQQRTLLESVTGMERAADVILVDASLDHPLGFSPLGLAAHETVIVMSAASSSITDAYALIKKVSLGYARKNFRILVNKVRSQEEADSVQRNIKQVAQSRGLAHLDEAGFVPLDEQLRQSSRLSQPVVGLFPDSPAAKACRMIAGDLLGWPFRGQAVGGLEQFVQQLLHLSKQIDPIAIYA